MNLRAVRWLLGSLCLMLAGCLLVPAGVSGYYHENRLVSAFLVSAVTTAVPGAILLYLGRNSLHTPDGRPAVFRREGVAVVALGWVLASLVGALPFVLGGVAHTVDAIFESTSGFTTTGATIFSGDEVDGLSHGIAFWRSLTHWIGGIGIVLVVVAILPSGGRSLFSSEGISREKSEVRVRDSALILLRVYVILTAAHVVFLWVAGMTPFDSVIHAFSSMATGGFSNHGASIAYYRSPLIEAICIVFMIAAGTGFTIWIAFLRRGFHGGAMAFARSSETRLYLLLLVSEAAVLTLLLWFWGGSNGNPASDLPDYARFLRCVRDASFSLTSIQTCTGYVTADFDRWPDTCRMLLMWAAFVGGCGGSTAGGIKVARLIIVGRASIAAVRSYANPRAVVRVPMDQRTLEPEEVSAATRYFTLWILFAVVSAGSLTLLGLDATSAVTGVISCMNNVGPGLAQLGPAANYGHLNILSKLILCATMIAGRLELYALVALFLPGFWRR